MNCNNCGLWLVPQASLWFYFTVHTLLSDRIIIITNREDICLQTLLLLLKYANHKNKRSFVSTANEALFGTLMTIGDVNNIFSI